MVSKLFVQYLVAQHNYYFSNDNIADVDECSMDNGGCNDTCENTIGSFICLCTDDGYIVGSDGLSCEGEICMPSSE